MESPFLGSLSYVDVQNTQMANCEQKLTAQTPEGWEFQEPSVHGGSFLLQH